MLRKKTASDKEKEKKVLIDAEKSLERILLIPRATIRLPPSVHCHRQSMYLQLKKLESFKYKINMQVSFLKPISYLCW